MSWREGTHIFRQHLWYVSLTLFSCLINDYIANITPCTGIKREWDGLRPWEASTSPSADKGESYTPVKRDGRRRKPVMDPDEDNDSVLEGGSAIGTPKRSSKKRKVDAGASKPGGLLAPKLPVAASVRGAKKPTRRSARGREVGIGQV
jgi:hypothetical protein